MQEQNRLGRDPFASRTPAQQANYDRLLNGVFASAKESWDILFRNNPQVLFVIAAGNDGGQAGVPDAGNNDINEVVPANSAMDFGNVITIAATTQAGLLADFSNFSSRSVSLGAWGKAVPSLAPADLKVVMSGTSMASPYVAGVASSIRRVNAKLTPQEVRLILEKTVRKTPSLQGKTITGGMVDPKAALAAARLALTTLDLQAAIQQAVSARELLEGSGGLRILDLGDIDASANQAVSKTDEWIKSLIRARSL